MDASPDRLDAAPTGPDRDVTEPDRAGRDAGRDDAADGGESDGGPCVDDAACTTDPPLDAGTVTGAITCGPRTCDREGERCFSCSGPDGEGGEPICLEDGAAPPRHDGGGCWFRMFLRCDGPEDCEGSCVYSEYDIGTSQCAPEEAGGCVPPEPSDFAIREATVCHELSDCPPCATECRPLTSYDWLAGTGVSIGVCAS